LIKPNKGFIGFASLVINGSIYLGSIGIYTKMSGGYRLTFPKKDGFDVFHPINRPTGLAIERAILEKLNDLMSRQLTDPESG